jgi:hypothetical protein
MLKRRSAMLGAAVVVSTLASWWAFAAGPGDPPHSLPYRGHLDLGGVAVTSTVALTFHVFDDATAGTELFFQTIPGVSVVGGDFAVILTGIPQAAYDSGALYVAIDVEGTPLLGRQAILPTMQAVRASRASNFTVDQTLTVNGRLNYPLTYISVWGQAAPLFLGAGGYAYAAWNVNNSTAFGVTPAAFAAANTIFLPPVKGVWNIKCNLGGSNYQESFISKNQFNQADLNPGNDQLLALGGSGNQTLNATALLLPSDAIACGTFSSFGAPTYNARTSFSAYLVQAVP